MRVTGVFLLAIVLGAQAQVFLVVMAALLQQALAWRSPCNFQPRAPPGAPGRAVSGQLFSDSQSSPNNYIISALIAIFVVVWRLTVLPPQSMSAMQYCI